MNNWWSMARYVFSWCPEENSTSWTSDSVTAGSTQHSGEDDSIIEFNFAAEVVQQIETLVELFRMGKIKKPQAIFKIGQVLAADQRVGLYTVRLTFTAVRLMVEYSTAKPLTVHQAIFWDCQCLRLQDSCITAENSGKQWTEIYFVKSTIIYGYSMWTLHELHVLYSSQASEYE